MQAREYTNRIPRNTLKAWNDVLMKQISWEYAGWSGAPKEPYRHWSASPKLVGEIARIWELVDDIAQEDGYTLAVDRVIANLFSHGDSSWLHKDSLDSSCWTAIVYLNDYWEDNWYGGTVVNTSEGFRYFSPTPGKIILFQSNLTHGPVPVSREALYPRLGVTFQCTMKDTTADTGTALKYAANVQKI